ncbi:CHAD domain-containing protein [Methyloceanibacter sp.]|uniref:CYTH and CHAD domain-containing protein n=1 Tax=Methyloceanibacter sp. TaxID=1965321 RepID=UPI00356736EE
MASCESQSSSNAKEIELKLEFDADAAPRILSHPIFEGPPPKTRELVSIYYDTGASDLRNAGVFLRVRSTGDGYVQTIKSAKSEGEFLERNEWECPVPTHEPNLDAAEGTALARLLTPEVRADLKPRFHTRFRRKTYDVRHRGAEIELAVDQGEATAGVKAAPISELELELKAGAKAALFSLARELAETAPLNLAVKTKAERGFELLDGADHTVENARRVVVTPDMTSAEAFRSIARNCLRQIVANAPAMREGRAEALHQMRVGLRRLRVAIALFGQMLGGDERNTIKDKLRWITQELGPARDLDVFAADVLEPMRAAYPGDREVEDTYRDFKERHAAAYARATQSANSDRFRVALLDITAWVETGDWARKNRKLAKKPVRRHALKQLARLRRGIKAKGRRLRDLSPAKRHRLRIRSKRLRYATEFFAATFPKKKSEERRNVSLAALEAIQDALGVLNDMATRKSLLATGQEDWRLRAPAIDIAEEEKWLKEAKRAYGRFAKAKAFWKA